MPGDVVFVQLSAGHLHTCGLGQDEFVRCWGRIGVEKSGKKFSMVSSGEFHACGLAKDKSVVCWGDDLGTGAAKPPGEKATFVTSGKDFSCGLFPDQGLNCWGDGSRGQLRPPEDVDWAVITASTSSPFACGLTRIDNDLRCWGGTSAEATTTADVAKGGQKDPPYAPSLLKGPFKQLGLGYRTTCVISALSGRLSCYGLLAHLLKGSPLDDDRSDDTSVPHLDQVSVGRDHICALTEDGQIICVGQPTASAATVPPGFVAA